MELLDLMVQLERMGIVANIHTIGDGASRIALDAIEHARTVVGLPKEYQLRHMLLHTYTLHDDDALRIAKLNIGAEFS